VRLKLDESLSASVSLLTILSEHGHRRPCGSTKEIMLDACSRRCGENGSEAQRTLNCNVKNEVTIGTRLLRRIGERRDMEAYCLGCQNTGGEKHCRPFLKTCGWTPDP
jgi:hypothetical protein